MQVVADLLVPEEARPARQEHQIFSGNSSPCRRRTPMTIRNKFSLIAIAALLISIAVIFFSRNSNTEGKVFIYAEPVQTKYGWGYNIIAGDKIHIRQEYMP